jgi:hypothetical protein
LARKIGGGLSFKFRSLKAPAAYTSPISTPTSVLYITPTILRFIFAKNQLFICCLIY